MKSSLSVRAFFCAVLLTFGASNAHATSRNWTNVLGGSWFDPLGWSPNGVPGTTDAATITNIGTYTVLVPTGAVSTAIITIGGASGKQTLVYGTATGQLSITNSTVQANGVLVITNSGLAGALLVQSGGELQFNSTFGLQLYNLSLTNQGTITWSNGSLSVGGNNSQTTLITNSGLWQIFGDSTDNAINYGGGDRPTVMNAGTIRKLTGTGTTTFNGMDLINLPSGLADVLSGTFEFASHATNVLGGSFTATSPGQMKFVGVQTDAGGTASGSGTFQFALGSFYFRSNTIPNLKLVGGDVYISGTTTFQNAGAITNLTLDGSVLHGTNRVTGTLTFNSGNVVDTLIIQPSGQLLFVSPSGTQLYGCNLINQGTVLWSGNSIAVGNTSISNGGTWTITGDSTLSYGGVGTAYFTNAGIVQKTGGTAVTSLAGAPFFNLPSGIVRAAAATLQMPNNYTNIGGELQLNGGTLTASGTFDMAAGKLDGNGTIGTTAVFDGGTISPGPTAGLIRFSSGLTLNSNATLVIDGTGTIPGSQYDQLSVTGAVAISNCTLQVASLPSVPAGTTFVIITNTTANATTGAFNGLPENSPLTISSQPFRIHYSGGSGNDVILVRDSLAGSQLSSGGYTNRTFRLLGVGSGATIYTVQATTNFLQWTNIGTTTGDLSGNFNFIDTNAANFRFRFYRTTN